MIISGGEGASWGVLLGASMKQGTASTNKELQHTFSIAKSTLGQVLSSKRDEGCSTTQRRFAFRRCLLANMELV